MSKPENNFQEIWSIITPLYDPLSKRLVTSFHFYNPSYAILFGFILGLVGKIITPAIDGVLLPRDGYISSISEWPSLFLWLIAIPFVFYFYFCYQPNLLNYVSLSLQDGGILESPKDEINATIHSYWSRARRIPWWILLAVISTILVIWHANDAVNFPGASKFWYTSNLTTFYSIRMPIIWMIIYIVTFLVLQHSLFTLLIRHLFRKYKVRIFVLHPDGAGGLGSLGKLSLSMSYLLASFMIAIIYIGVVIAFIQRVGSPIRIPSYVFLLISYAIVAPMVFFLPLSFAHNEMKRAKESALLEFGSRARKLIEDSQMLMPQDKPLNLKPQVDELESITKIYTHVAKFPVWPFNTQTISKFALTLIIPIIPTLIFEIIMRLLFP